MSEILKEPGIVVDFSIGLKHGKPMNFSSSLSRWKIPGRLRSSFFETRRTVGDFLANSNSLRDQVFGQ